MLLVLGCASDPVGPADTTAVVFQPGVPWTVNAGAEPLGDEWEVATPAEAGFDEAKLAALDTWAFSRQGDDVDRKGIRTNGLVILRHGRLVYERYARGYDVDKPLLTWSVSKSFGNTLVGAAVKDGYIDINAPVAKYVPEMAAGRHAEVRITDLLRMSSGIAWGESYETSPVFSSVMAMLYTRGRGDMGIFTASQPMAHPPGTHWSYSSGDSNLLMLAVKNAVPADRYPTMPWTAVFDPLGMKNVTWERDGSGTFVGSSYVYATPRDIARWAQLYLQDGVWNGQRLLPEGWVRYTTTLAPAFSTTPVRRELHEDNPGAQWYVNVGDPLRGLKPPLPHAPADTFGAVGHWGKRVWVIPSLDLVIVRMGDDRQHLCHDEPPEDCVADPDAAYDDDTMLGLLIASVKP